MAQYFVGGVTRNSVGSVGIDPPSNATSGVAVDDNASVNNPNTGGVSVATAAVGKALWRVLALAEPIKLPLAPKYSVPTAAEQVERAARMELGDLAQLAALQAGDEVRLALLDGRVAGGWVNLVQREADGRTLIGGALADGGSFSLGVGATVRSSGGTILPANGGMAYVVQSGTDGAVYLLEKQREYVLCELPPPPAPPGDVTAAAAALVAGGASSGAGTAAITVPEPDLGFAAVIYLDFDGEIVNDPDWNGGNTVIAAESGLTVAQQEEVRRRVAEDYRPFQISVSTSRARYDAAPPNQRMRCIVSNIGASSPSNWFDAGAAGVAYIASWTESGVGGVAADIPAWVYSDRIGFVTADIAFAISHEVGHTLGLSHDGLKTRFGVKTDEYYFGRGSGVMSWGPIMGAPYGRTVSQWSNGDYTDGTKHGSNTEDDLAIIADINNHTGFRKGDNASTRTESAALVTPGATTVSLAGAIGRTGETDMFVFAASGSVTLSVADDSTGTSEENLPNLDAKLTIFNGAGAVVTMTDPADSMFPTLTASLAPGIYFLGVTGVGQGTSATGWSNYGSLGRYRLTGTISQAPGLSPTVFGAATASAAVGTAFGYQIAVAAATATFSAAGLPVGLVCNPMTGAISGTPMVAGSYAVTLTATNVTGSGTGVLQLTVLPALLAEALDAPAALAFTSGGDAPWLVDNTAVHDGVASARSGVIMNNGKQSFLQTTVTGPGRLTFWWKVSSEADATQNYDILNFTLDGNELAQIGGELDWAQRTFTLPAGAHTLRWAYTKDPYVSVGADAGWVDGMTFVPTAFESWAPLQGLAGGAAASAADPDGDGLDNLLEYALGLDPRAPGVPPAGASGGGTSAGLPVITTVDDAGTLRLELTFIRPPAREDLIYTVEISDDLVTWIAGHAYGTGIVNGAGLPTLEMERATLGDGSERIRVRDFGGAGATRRFMRVSVTRP